MPLHVNEMAIEIALKKSQSSGDKAACGEESVTGGNDGASRDDQLINETVRRVLEILERRRSR